MRGFWWWPFGKVPEVSARQLEGRLRDRAARPQLVDVRTLTEWRAGHIAGAIHVPIGELDARLPGLRLDGARPIVAICRSAHRSVPAVRLLHKHGFNEACQLQGGMLAWLREGLPVEVDGDQKGR
jgi:rhodanese-related sulfurtransferase